MSHAIGPTVTSTVSTETTLAPVVIAALRLAHGAKIYDPTLVCGRAHDVADAADLLDLLDLRDGAAC